MRSLRLTLAFLVGTIASCTSTVPVYNDNSSLVVTYEGKEVHRRNTGWISLHEFAKLEHAKRAIVIFGAPWCKACMKLRKAINQANLKEKVYYVNIDEPWARDVATSIKLKQIPIMFLLEDGKAKLAKLGPSEIVMWLLINVEST